MTLHRIEYNEPGLFLDMTCSVLFSDDLLCTTLKLT